MKNFFIFIKYSPISNRNVNTVIRNMNNIESNSSDEMHNINNDYYNNSVINKNNNSIDSENRIINISDSKNNTIVTDKVMDRSIGKKSF